MLSAGGNQIYHYRANPVVFDLDQDGLKDLVVGDNSGMVFFYKNVGTNAVPVFNATFDTLKTQGGTIIDAYYGSRINFVDWTEDGDPDMLISGYDGNVQLYENSMIGVEEQKGWPVVVDLSISPNPVVDRTVLKYSLDASTHVSVRVYSADGRLVTTLIDRQHGPGSHQFVWNIFDKGGGTLPAGIYLLRFDAGTATDIQRIVIIH